MAVPIGRARDVVPRLAVRIGGAGYPVTALRGDAKSREAHEAMDFDGGWNAALDQLVVLAPKNRTIAARPAKPASPFAAIVVMARPRDTDRRS